MTKIAIASDHAGTEIKSQIIDYMTKSGYDITDFGPANTESVDYPDYAFKVAEAVSSGKYQKGVLLCGTGMGMCIAAGKVKGIRAVTPYDRYTTEMSRRHNNANIICFGARSLELEIMTELIKLWLETDFDSGENAVRHEKRLQKISDYEKSN